MILITGADGWLGLGLAEGIVRKGLHLHQEVRVLCLSGTDTAAVLRILPQARVYHGDVRDGSGLQSFFEGAAGAKLLHTVGVIHPQRVSDFYAVNRDGADKVLRAASNAGVARAVVVSSNSPCGCNPHPDHIFDEESPYHPYMNYGRSKMEMEKLALGYHRSGAIEVVLIRAPWFYGTHQPPRQKLFFEMIRDGKGPLIGGGQNLRSMAYIDNLADGILLAADSPVAAGQVYWIADERPYAMVEIIDTIERLLETEFGQVCTHKRLRLPGIISDVAEMADAALQRLGLYHQKIHVLSEMNKTIACSIEKAKRELGYRPQVALEEGMRRSLEEVYGKSQGPAAVKG